MTTNDCIADTEGLCFSGFERNDAMPHAIQRHQSDTRMNGQEDALSMWRIKSTTPVDVWSRSKAIPQSPRGDLWIPSAFTRLGGSRQRTSR
jgi:hypothetical protein